MPDVSRHLAENMREKSCGKFICAGQGRVGGGLLRCRSGPPLLADAGRCKHPSPPGWEALMSEAYDGREIVGMDLHRRRSVLVRMTPDGRKLETTRITNSPAELRRVIARAGKHPRVVLEATYGWYWAADTLAAAGAKVHLAHPLGVRGFRYRRVKNDEKDAADLADLLRLGRLPEAWIAPAEIRELRELTAEITVLEAAIADLLARHDGYHAIRALPGIGPVLGAVLVAEIGDITRFATPARLCSWAGL